jgi:glutamine cyclotransferase
MWRNHRSAGSALAIVVSVLFAPSAQAEPAAGSAVPVTKPVVLAQIPHDRMAYTEGLELDGPSLWEGTGQAGQSQLRELDPATGAVRRATPMPGNYFGEGITVVGDRIWQFTYRDGVAVEWDKASLTPVREVPLSGERWGLCLDGDRLISSNGTDRLSFLNPADLADAGGVTVTRDGLPIGGLNELECVDGQVWANVWPSDTIVRIDPSTGRVNAVVDGSGLWPGGRRTSAQVLSGIAHLGGDEYLLTGKFWPSAFRVRLAPPAA